MNLYHVVQLGQIIIIKKSVPFFNEYWFKALKETSQLFASFSAIAGLVLVFIGINTYKQAKQKEQEELEFRKNEYTVKILEKVSDQLIPTMGEFNTMLKAELKELNDKEKENNISIDKKEEIILAIKLECGIVDIFNSLESITSYVKLGLVNTDAVYEPVNKVILKFTNDHKDVYKYLKNRVPYANLTYVVENWDKKRKIEYLENQKENIDKILEKEKNT